MSRRTEWAEVAAQHRRAASIFDYAATIWSSKGKRDAADSCAHAAQSNRDAAVAAEWCARPWYRRLTGRSA